MALDTCGQAEGAIMDQEQHDNTQLDAIKQDDTVPGRHWYAIHTYSGYENKVKTHIEARTTALGLKDQIFRVVVPTEDEIEIKGGQRRTVTRKVYPGYVLIDMILTADTWHAVRGTPGVTGFIGGTSTEPVPLSESELRYILRAPTETGEEVKPKTKINFTVGQSVKVIDGPFAEFIGTVNEIHPERNKVTVLVSFFGRETPVQLDFLQVEKV
ncbi:MAG: Transcription antitermination protein NusG [Ktedonobacterales bacterium]|jgi:transcriptional antiterminator NusG|nr:MAG: Transcription antitermination protein NusG [Ktedonobacterales bacterium]